MKVEKMVGDVLESWSGYFETSKLGSRHLGFFSMLWGARKCVQKRQNGEKCITQKALVVLFLLGCRSHAFSVIPNYADTLWLKLYPPFMEA